MYTCLRASQFDILPENSERRQQIWYSVVSSSSSSQSIKMFRSLWRSIDRFSLQYFKYIVNELQQIKVVNNNNRELVVDIMQSIVEIVTYGDKHDPSIFECFMEYQVLAEFVRLLKNSRNSRIEAPLLQYLSIMIQNMESEHAIYYCLSNDYINSIVTHQYEFDKGDLIQYYISFLRAVSCKVNRDMLCLLVKVHQDIVVAFPLYSEALKFALHGEKMIQVAVRAVTLNIYNVSDDMVYQFMTSSPVSDYFSDLVQNLKEQCIHLDALISARGETCTHEWRKELLTETDKIVDDLYYLKDLLVVGESRLSRLVTQNLLSFLVFPILLPLLQLSQSNGLNLSALTSLCIVSRLLQVVDEEDMFNSVASVIIYPHMSSRIEGAIEADTACGMTQNNPSVNHMNAEEEMLVSCHEPEGTKNIYMNSHFRQFSEYMSSISCPVSFPLDNIHGERSGILSYVVSDDYGLFLASLLLLIILAENTDFDSMLAAMMGSSQTEVFFQKIINRLMKILASQPPFSVLIQWHTGWFLRKLLIQEKKFSNHEFHLFNISYEQSLNCLRKELDGCWFDHIPDTLRKEWGSCKSALEESSHSKDPFFILELDFHQEATEGSMSSSLAWRSMVDAIKVFVLHLQLKAFVLKGDHVENPLINLRSNIIAISGKTHVSVLSPASFGSELALGCAVPCKIALSKVGIKDLYALPMARGISGKLLLLEKHPFHNQHGIVFAVAPLAGLSPKIDEKHRTWLHLRIREFDPKFGTGKFGIYDLKKANHVTDGRWTLGFSDAETCEAARLFIIGEIDKQRSAVEKLLAPLLQDNCPGDQSDGKS